MFICLCENIKHSRVLTTKSVDSIHHDTFDSLYPLLTPPHPHLLWWPPLSYLYLCLLLCLFWFVHLFRFCSISDSTHEWNRTVFAFLHLTYFTYMLNICPCCYKWQDFIFLMAEYSSIAYRVYGVDIFFIHSSVDGHLGCFYIYLYYF